MQETYENWREENFSVERQFCELSDAEELKRFDALQSICFVRDEDDVNFSFDRSAVKGFS